MVAAEPAALRRARLLALRIDDRAPHHADRRQQHRHEGEHRAAEGEQQRVLAEGGRQRLAAGDRGEGRRVAERGDGEHGQQRAEQRRRHGDQQALGERQPEQLRGAGAAAAVDRDLLRLAVAGQRRQHDDVEGDDARHLQEQQQQRDLREGAGVAELGQRLGELEPPADGQAEAVAQIAPPDREVVERARDVAHGQALQVRDDAGAVA